MVDHLRPVLPQRSAAAVGEAAPSRTWSAAELLAAAFLCSIGLGQVGKVPLAALEVKQAPLLVSDFLTLATAAWLFGSTVLAGRVRIDRSIILIALFIAANLVSIGLTAARFNLSFLEVCFSSLYLLRWVAYVSLYAFALSSLRLASAGKVIRTALAVCGVFAGFGIIQAIFLPNFAFLVYPDAIPYVDWDVQGNRLVSTFLDPNFAGGFIMFGLLFLHAQGAELRRPSYALLAVFWVALLLTLSRSSILTAIGGLGIITLRTRSFHKLVFPVAGACLVVVLFAQPILDFARNYQKLTFTDPSALARLASWLLAWRVFADNPILGVGYNTFGLVRPYYGSATVGNAAFGSDGGILFVAAVGGLLGVGLLGLLLWRLASMGLRAYRTTSLTPSVRALGLTIHAWIPCLLVHSAASNSIFYPFIIGTLFLLSGVCAQQCHGLGGRRATEAHSA